MIEFTGFIREQFVKIYFRPLSEIGVSIADHEQFMRVIPEEDLTPLIQRLHQDVNHAYLTNFTPEQLAFLSDLFRDYPQISVENLSHLRLDRATAEEAILASLTSETAEAAALDLEQLVIRLNAYDALPRAENATPLHNEISLATVRYFLAIEYGQDLRSYTRDLGHPIFRALVQAAGVLRSSNPVLRQNLLRELSSDATANGIQFIRPEFKSNSNKRNGGPKGPPLRL